MEKFFNHLKINNRKILDYANQLDQMIITNEYDHSDIKYLIRNVVYPIIRKESKKLYKTKQIDNKRILIKYLFELIIISMHVIVINHTMPVYFMSEYHEKIYKLCDKLDKMIALSKDKKLIYIGINEITHIIEIIADESFDLSDERIKMLYDKKNKINLSDRKIMKEQLQNKLKKIFK
jgi:hypothetical protein